MARISDSNPTALDFEPIDGVQPEAAATPSAATAPTDELVDAKDDFSGVPAGFSDAAHAQFPTSDGFPRYTQGDKEWGSQPLGAGTLTLAEAGCAMSSAAMAASGMDGITVTPSDADSLAKSEGAMIGNRINFDKLVLGDVHAKRVDGFTPKDIDAELAAGRPVEIAVHHHSADPDHNDHWILLTRRDPSGTYHANDPASGKSITLHVDDHGVLTSDEKGRYNHAPSDFYRFTGSAVTFSRPS